MLRSCYSTDCVFGTDPSIRARIQWYFASPESLDLGFPTTFMSRNYVDAGIWPDVGEFEGATRPWRNGSFPIPVKGTGEPCGDRTTWAEGANVPDPPGLQRNDFGLAFCCAGQVALNGQPMFEILPGAFERLGVVHYANGVVASQGTAIHDLVATVAIAISTFHEFDATVAASNTVSHGFQGTVVPEFGVFHAFSGTVKALRSVVQEFVGTIAEEKTIYHEFFAHVGTGGSVTHSFGATVCPAPGVFITSDPTGFWTCPPAIHFRGTYLWAAGGNGYAVTSSTAGAGGGGGGFSAKIHAPVTPGQSYAFVNQPPGVGPASHIFHDSGEIFATTGSDAVTATAGAGGIGAAGDVNTIGGTGGTTNFDGTGNIYGGGGGGVANILGNGGAGGDATTNSSGVGGLAADGMGNGGHGGNPLMSNGGQIGFFPGGGGGGAGTSSGGTGLGRFGADGLLLLTWQAAVHFFHGTVYQAKIITHDLKGVVAARKTITHDLKGVVAARKTITHDLKGVVAAKKTVTHMLNGYVQKSFLLDYFSDAGNPPLSSHTMSMGPGWTVFSQIGTANNLAIFSTVFVGQNTTPEYQKATSDAGSANHTCELFFEPGNAAGGWVEAVCRWQDSSNFCVVQAIWSAGGALNLYKVIGGAVTLLGTATMPALTAGNFYTLRILSSATQLTASIFGTGITTVTIGPVSETALATQTKFGFGIRRDDSLGIFFSRGWRFRVF